MIADLVILIFGILLGAGISSIFLCSKIISQLRQVRQTQEAFLRHWSTDGPHHLTK